MPAPTEISLMILTNTEDVTKRFEGYSKLKVERVYENLWLMKDGLQFDDAVQIKDAKVYDLAGVVQIQKIGKAKSNPTLYGTLY